MADYSTIYRMGWATRQFKRTCTQDGSNRFSDAVTLRSALPGAATAAAR